MAIYTGHEVDKIMPQMNLPQEGPELSAEQVRSWWETLSTSVPADEALGVSFADGKNLYYYTDAGKFVRAVNEGERLDSPEVQKRLMENSLSGRLFTRANEDASPRQVVTYAEEGEEPEVGVATPGSFNAFVWEHAYNARRPEPLPFWKYLLWPFSSAVRAEIKTHREETAKYDADHKEYLWIDNITTKDESSCVYQDRQEVIEKEAAIREQERERARQERRIQAEKDAAAKEVADAEQKKQEWSKNLHDMPLDEYLKYSETLNKEFSSGSPLRDILHNKHATYEDVLDGVVRMLECGLIHAVSGINQHQMDVNQSERIMVQKTAYQGVKEGLREYALKNIDQNLIKAAFESRSGSSMEANDLIRELQKFGYNYSYFNERGIVTSQYDLESPAFNDAYEKGNMLSYQRQARGVDLQHFDGSAEGFRKDMEQIKERWNPDVSGMSPEEFEKYRGTLQYKYNEDAYDYIIRNPNATPDDIYDIIAKEMELLMNMDQRQKPGFGDEPTALMTTLYRGKVSDVKDVDLTTDFYTVQQKPWQKAKEAMNQLARKYVSAETVKKFLEGHDPNGNARDNFNEKIRGAYKSAKSDLQKLGMIFEPKDLTPDVVKNMMVERYKREGPEGMKNISEALKQHALLQNGVQPTAQQAQMQQPEAPKAGPAAIGR